MENPKVFISYSWSDPQHQQLVKHWADRLIADGVDVVLDIYDLKEGDDKYAFMESMVTDVNVTHVLVVCDSEYAKKANTRKAGVGTESQIISGEVYKKVKQSKFIPILCEFDDNGEPILPVFMQARIGINFSSNEAENENWEQLIRLLYGKPQYVKPIKGKAPTFITSDTPIPTSQVFTKFSSLKQALLQDKKGLNHYRRDFLDSCISYADNLRTRERPDVDCMGKKILEDCSKLKAVRNHLCDWIQLESEFTKGPEFSEALIDTLEKLNELKSVPPEINSWNESWFEAHSVFVYETFLYIIATLLKSGSYSVLNDIYTSHYLIPKSKQTSDNKFTKFGCFYGYSKQLQLVLAPAGQQLSAPAAELIKIQADREDIPFSDIMQADLLSLLMALISDNVRWYPATLHYSSYNNEYPFFIRSTQHKHYLKLTEITGIDSVEILKTKVQEGYERHNIQNWNDFFYADDFLSSMNINKLDSLI